MNCGIIRVNVEGGIGRVVTEDHPLTNLWVSFATRHEGEWNFLDKIGVYNLTVGRNRPIKTKMDGPYK